MVAASSSGFILAECIAQNNIKEHNIMYVMYASYCLPPLISGRSGAAQETEHSELVLLRSVFPPRSLSVSSSTLDSRINIHANPV